MFDHALKQFKNKLLFWGSKLLSLAHRALVANQVILQSIWYFAALATPPEEDIKFIKNVIRGFIWGATSLADSTKTRVVWSQLILPKARGGLAVLDPLLQIKALQARWFPHLGMMVGSHCLGRCRNASPLSTTQWQPSMRWLVQGTTIELSGPPAWIFMLVSWMSFRSSLRKHIGSTKDSIMRQPLFFDTNDLTLEEDLVSNRQCGKREKSLM